MRAEKSRQLSRALFVLALVSALAALIWSLDTPPPPSADRYDYVGRAFQATQGEGLSPLVGYPLRMVFPGAESWPPRNLTRPPAWPAMLVPAVRFGLDSLSGVWVSFGMLILLLVGMRWVGDRTFGGAAGAMAAWAFAASYSSWIVLRGGGPELALALVTLVLWTWIPRGGGVLAHLACGTLYGILPLLHPTGWIFALGALVARGDRYDRSMMPWVLLGALAVVLPWHLRLWTLTGNPLGTLQSYAELTRNLDDPGGIAPYRGLVLHPTAEVLAQRWVEVLHLGLHRLKMQFLHLDAWLSWPLVALALYGARHEARLALRDAIIGIACFAVLAPWSAEFRTVLPLLPIACLWVGAGFARLVDHFRPSFAIPAAIVALVAPWVLPLGASGSPLEEDLGYPPSALSPPASVVNHLRESEPLGAPIFTDSANLALRARRGALLLPIDPPTLERLRHHPALRSLRVVALGQGRGSHWCDTDEWQAYLARCEVLYEHPEGPVLLALPTEDVADSSGSRASAGADAVADSSSTAGLADSSSTAGASIVPTVTTPVDSSSAAAPVDSSWTRRIDREHRLGPEELPSDLVAVAVPPATREGLRLRAEAYGALMRMLDAARSEEGLEIRVLSAFRDYARQEDLFEDAERRHGAGQAWVAPPGASEHQLGSTVDLGDAAMRHVLDASFADTPEGRWLAENARRFGFTLSYPPGSFELTGYHPEPWHFRYRPLPEE